MLPLEVVFAALFGLIFGSFLNVCIVRLPQGGSVVHPRSRCPACGTPIRPLDNVPLVSWLALRGRSRCCRQSIALRYPLVEAATALLFVGCLAAFGLTVAGVGIAVFCWLLLGLAWMDAETFLLPDAFTLPGLVLGVVYQGLLSGLRGIGQSLLSAIACGGLLLVIALLYKALRHREGMGMGDVKLAAMLGSWLGWKLTGIALFLAVVTGAVFGIILLLSRKTGQKGPLRLPLGTFLASAGILTVFAGDALLRWYSGFF